MQIKLMILLINLRFYFLNLEKDKLRKLTVFYLSLDGIFELNENSFNGIEAISQESSKKDLLPVLKKNEKFNLEAIKQEVINFIQDLLVLTSDEIKYSHFATKRHCMETKHS